MRTWHAVGVFLLTCSAYLLVSLTTKSTTSSVKNRKNSLFVTNLLVCSLNLPSQNSTSQVWLRPSNTLFSVSSQVSESERILLNTSCTTITHFMTIFWCKSRIFITRIIVKKALKNVLESVVLHLELLIKFLPKKPKKNKNLSEKPADADNTRRKWKMPCFGTRRMLNERSRLRSYSNESNQHGIQTS